MIVGLEYFGLASAIREGFSVEADSQFSGLGFVVGIVCAATFILSVIFGLATFFYIDTKTWVGKKVAFAWTLPAMAFPPISTWFLINPNHFLNGLLNGSLTSHICFLTLPFIFVAILATRIK